MSGQEGGRDPGSISHHETLRPLRWTECLWPGLGLFRAFILVTHLEALPPVWTHHCRTDIPICPSLYSAGTATRQSVSLCTLADAGALLSQGKAALVSSLPIARQLLSWPHCYLKGSLSCSTVFERRRLQSGSSRTSPLPSVSQSPVIPGRLQTWLLCQASIPRALSSGNSSSAINGYLLPAQCQYNEKKTSFEIVNLVYPLAHPATPWISLKFKDLLPVIFFVSHWHH